MMKATATAPLAGTVLLVREIPLPGDSSRAPRQAEQEPVVSTRGQGMTSPCFSQ